MRTLSECRFELDALDTMLVELYLKRLKISEEIGRIKAASGAEIYDKAREDDIIARRTEGLDETKAAAVEALYRTVFDVSRRIQSGISEGGKDK